MNNHISHIVWEGDNQFEIEEFLGVEELETDDSPDILLIPTKSGIRKCDLGHSVVKDVHGNVSVQKDVN